MKRESGKSDPPGPGERDHGPESHVIQSFTLVTCSAGPEQRGICWSPASLNWPAQLQSNFQSETYPKVWLVALFGLRRGGLNLTSTSSLCLSLSSHQALLPTIALVPGKTSYHREPNYRT